MQACLWACGRGDVSTPSFGSHLNPISTRGADYAHSILMSPPSFESHRRACCVMSTNFLFSKVFWQCPAMFCLYTSSNFSRPWFEFSLKVKVMGLNPGYHLKSFLLCSLANFNDFLPLPPPKCWNLFGEKVNIVRQNNEYFHSWTNLLEQLSLHH